MDGDEGAASRPPEALRKESLGTASSSRDLLDPRHHSDHGTVSVRNEAGDGGVGEESFFIRLSVLLIITQCPVCSQPHAASRKSFSVLSLSDSFLHGAVESHLISGHRGLSFIVLLIQLSC